MGDEIVVKLVEKALDIFVAELEKKGHIARTRGNADWALAKSEAIKQVKAEMEKANA